MTTVQTVSPVQLANAEADRVEARQAVLVFAYGLRGILLTAGVLAIYCQTYTQRAAGELLGVGAMTMLACIGVDFLVRTVCRIAHTD